MAGDIVIGGGGSIAVATSELFDDARRLDELRSALSECQRQLVSIDRLVRAPQLATLPLPSSAIAAERAMDDAAAAIASATPVAERLQRALIASANAYGFGEQLAERVSREAAARFGALFGMFLPVIALQLLPLALGIGIGLGIGLGIGTGAGLALLSAGQRASLLRELPGWLRRNSSVLSDPGFVQFVRLTVMSADDFGGGLLRLPPELVHAIGDEGLGLVGLATSSSVVVGLARTGGALVESPVTVTRFGDTVRSSRASSFSDRAARVPTGAAQVRIDRYSQPGEADRFEVYIGGTRDFSPTSGPEPWDMTSNLNSMAGQDSGSYRAVTQAMAVAGVTASTPVIFTGYSQGGLVAAGLAASGEFDTRGLYTLGAPAAQVAVPAGIPWVAIEHTDDVVPALGGSWASADPVLVRRELFDGRPVSTDVMFPAHQLAGYRETASLVDRSREQRLVDALSRFDSFASGTTRVDSTLYLASRGQAMQSDAATADPARRAAE